MNIRTLILGPLATAACCIAGPALATGSASASSPDVQTKSVTLRYDPSDLRTVKGAERLLARVSGAAARVCGRGDTIAEVYDSSAFRTCRHDAIAHAVVAIDRPTVTALYDRRFAEKGERGLHAALELRPVVEIEMVAVGWTEPPEPATTAPAL